ncbi:MAG: hypothetical protein VW127_05865 [Flavobacteriaceae bacterium]
MKFNISATDDLIQKKYIYSIDFRIMIGRFKTSSAYFFYKSILRKVSFDPSLFEKELNKAMSLLPKNEGVRLYRWALAFSKTQPELLVRFQYSY